MEAASPASSRRCRHPYISPSTPTSSGSARLAPHPTRARSCARTRSSPARSSLARAGAGDAARWRSAAEAIRASAPGRTHPISAALLGDLLDGEGWAPLHDLASALAAGAPEAAAREAARRLTRLGHSSGWDLLAGFVAGAAA